MGSLLSSVSQVPSGPSKRQGDGQATQGVPAMTGAAPVAEKKPGESSPPPPPPPSPPPTTTTTRSKWVRPANFSDIVGDKMGGLSDEQLGEKMFKGIYPAGKAMKYWVDKSTNANCFMLFARALDITWGSDTRYWSWSKRKEVEETSEIDAEEADMEVAYLEDVCWLEIRGSLSMSHLTPGCTYDVAFLAKLKEDASYGWSVPVDLELKVPNGAPSLQSRKENLSRMEGKQGWTELRVGEVVVPQAGLKGDMGIAMLRLGGEWKSGLTLLGIRIAARSPTNKQ